MEGGYQNSGWDAAPKVYREFLWEFESKADTFLKCNVSKVQKKPVN